MTTRALAAPPARVVRDALLAGLAGLIAPHLAALAWGLVSSAVWGAAPRIIAFLDPAAPRPRGYAAASLLVTAVLGALLGGALARALSRGAGAGRWGFWGAFAAGVVCSAAAVGGPALRSPVLLLFIAASALGFRLAARD